ncbi:MAG: large ribosomal subunit protein bL35 [Candidatus Dojkabacteria bacterium]
MAKNKIKTHKATQKRFKKTGSGKLKHFHQGDNAHLKVNKSKKQLNRQEGTSTLASKKQEQNLKALLAT